MSTSNQIATMSLVEAVKLSGGNGLATPLFEVPAEFFNVFSWQYVEIGMEAVIIDGQVMRQSDVLINPLGLLFRRQYARRVLLRPAPLIDVSAKALTSDQLDLMLTVSINYRVTDPLKVTAMEAPIPILTNIVMALVAEHIRSDMLTNIVKDEGQLRATLRERLNAAPSLRDTFEVIEVLKAIPLGDERLIEIGRQVREEEARTALIAAEGKNRAAEHGFSHDIAELRMQLEEQQKETEHRRKMQLREAELMAQNFQSMAAAMALAASAGGDTAKLADMFLKITSKSNISEAPDALPAPDMQTAKAEDQPSNNTDSDEEIPDHDA